MRATTTRRPTRRSSCCSGREMGIDAEFFQLESFRIIVEKREDGQTVSEATVKVHVDGDRFIETAEGERPRERARQGAAHGHRAEVSLTVNDIRLVNYSVRILDENRGTAATTRVLLDSSDGKRQLGQRGRERERGGSFLAGAGRFDHVRAARFARS